MISSTVKSPIVAEPRDQLQSHRLRDYSEMVSKGLSKPPRETAIAAESYYKSLQNTFVSSFTHLRTTSPCLPLPL